MGVFGLWLLLLPGVAGASSGSEVTSEGRISPELRAAAVTQIRETLRHESRWGKVHAAEYLLALDYPEDVAKSFRQELAALESEPGYRVGIWRVLARAAPTDAERTAWVMKIRDVFLDPEATDRGHAAETLAKLKYSLRDEGDQCFVKATADEDLMLATSANWILANSGRASGIVALGRLLEARDPRVRGYAAYALRHLPTVPDVIREQLATALQHEPADSPARAQMAAAATVHARPGDQEPSNVLRTIALSGNDSDRYEAAHALAAVGTAADVVLLARLMQQDVSADVRAAAAYGVLRIDRRAPRCLAVVDWAVIVAYMMAMLAIGWYYSRRAVTTDDYLLGGRNMKPLGVGLSLFATLMSTITYLSLPGELIKHGPTMLCMMLAYPFVFLVAGYLMIPFIMKLRITSAYEILETRLGLSVRMLGSTLFLAMRLAWMAVIIFATTDKVLVPLLDLPPGATPVLCAILGVITLIYTSMGGLRAVVVTDVTQTLILFGAALLTVILVTVKMGDVGSWWPTSTPAHWAEFEWISWGGRASIVGVAVAYFAWWVCTAGSDQMAIQRYLATRDARAARSVLVTSLWANTFVNLILAACGLALLAYFRANPHLVPDGHTILTDADTLFPRFIVHGMPAGLSGLVIAGLLAAAMSSLSSGMNSSCSVVTVDFIDRFRRNKETQTDHVRLAKYVSVVVGAIVVALSSGVGMVKGNLLEVAFKVVNLLTAPLFGLFFMAMFVRWASAAGTLIGAVFGLATVVVITYWKDFTGNEAVSFLWAMPISLVVQVAVGMVASAILPAGKKAETPSPQYPEKGS